MKKSIKISIPEQCHEDWNKMTPTEKGKFCDVCTKEVFDFTKINDEELIKRLDRGDNLCGRFRASQLNREIKLERKSRISLAPLAASFLLPFTLFASNKKEANFRDSLKQGGYISLDIGKHVKISSERIQIITTGYIKDNKGNPLKNVEISVLESEDKVFSDKRGYFEITSLNDETLKFSKEGFDIKTITLARKSTEQNITLISETITLYNDNNEFSLIGEISIEKEVDSITKENPKQINVVGNVIDETGFPLPGVNILIKGTKKGAQTDFDGNYAIEVDNNEILVFSYVGFKTEEITISNINTTIDLKMTMTEDMLGGIIIVGGYSTITTDDSKSIMGYKENNYDSEPAPWKKKFLKAFENQKKFRQIKKERKKTARKLKRK